jgi:hypothetical protein
MRSVHVVFWVYLCGTVSVIALYALIGITGR